KASFPGQAGLESGTRDNRGRVALSAGTGYGGEDPAMSNAVPDSRLTVPQLPPRHVSRPRLLAELDRAAAFPLTLLSAGPGAGKTVLRTDGVRRGGLLDGEGGVAWLPRGPADAEPSRFWRLLESSRRDL